MVFSLKKWPPGFTLIELLVVIAVMGVLATIVLVAVNPGAQIAKARDAQRKQDISAIAKAIEAYVVFAKRTPTETWCDSSTGLSGVADCPVNPPQSNWNTTQGIYPALVNGGYIKKLPVDPVNNTEFFYRYEPNTATDYWIGAKLEQPTSPSEAYFRCATTNASTAGCRYVNGWLL